MLLFPSELFDVICDRDFGPDKDLHPFLHLKHLVMKPFIPACVEILEQQVRELESSKSNWEPMPSTTFIELTNLRDEVLLVVNEICSSYFGNPCQGGEEVLVQIRSMEIMKSSHC
jgi:hypothetical protein